MNTPIDNSAPKPNMPILPMPDAQEGLGKEGLEKAAAAKTMSQMPPPNFEGPALTTAMSPEVLELIENLKSQIKAGGGQTNMKGIEPISMGITSIGGVGSENQGDNQAQMLAQIKSAPPVKNIASLVPGQMFSAEILDIQQGAVTLKMAEGGSLTARSLVVPDARIGDKATFVVKDAKPGQIALEFLRGDGMGKVSASIIKEALGAANMQYTAANGNIVEDLVTRGMPIDTNNLQRAAFFKYSMPNAPFEHIQFLMENNFAATERTVEVFNGLFKGEMSLTGEIAKTLAALENPSSLVPPGEAREGFVAQLKQFLNVQPQASQQQAAGQPIQNAQPEVFLEALKMAAQEIAQMAKAQSGGDATPLSQSAENIADIIDFAKNITDTKLYMQFPFSVEDRKHLAELHVFKRKGDKNKKINGDKATALLALDMAFLGRVEVLVNKAGKTVNVQFRSDKGSTLDTVALNRKDLSDLLNNAGFTLTNVQTKKINEKFDITQTQQEARGLPREMAIQPRQDDGPARYSFDVRV